MSSSEEESSKLYSRLLEKRALEPTRSFANISKPSDNTYIYPRMNDNNDNTCIPVSNNSNNNNKSDNKTFTALPPILSSRPSFNTRTQSLEGLPMLTRQPVAHLTLMSLGIHLLRNLV